MTDLTEQRLCQLEAEVNVIKKNMLHRDEVREKVWNDLQEDLLHLVREDHEYIKRVDERTQRLECKFEVMQADLDCLSSRVTRMESDISEIKTMLRQALKLDQ